MSDALPTLAGPPRAAKLGEELPIFCEKCGYSLFGLPPIRCEQCNVLQFQCPECGHHQPINTLRPAFQKVLGRMRAGTIVLVLLFKLFVFSMTLIGWCAMGYEWSFTYWYTQNRRNLNYSYVLVPRDVTLEMVIAFGIFALAWGMVARMMLLRWRQGYLVGLVLGGLALAAIVLGSYMRWNDGSRFGSSLPGPILGGLPTCLALVLTVTTLGATVVWGIWWGLAHTLLPRRTAEALIAWQNALSEKASDLARE